MSDYIWNPSAIPHVNDKEGRKAYRLELIEQIKRLGGRPTKVMGFDKLRKMYSELTAKTKEDE